MKELKCNVLKIITDVRDQIESDLIDVVGSKLENKVTDIIDTVIKSLRTRLKEVNDFILQLLFILENKESIEDFELFEEVLELVKERAINIHLANAGMSDYLKTNKKLYKDQFDRLKALEQIKLQFVMEFKKVDGCLEKVEGSEDNE